MKNFGNHSKIVIVFLFILLPIQWNLAMDNYILKKTDEFLNHKLDSLEGFEVKARTAEITGFEGFSALKLDGMILFPGQTFTDACIEVEILAREACYPGIVFRYVDDGNYELAYPVPHASNQPDAIQYDPVFNMSNTWQLYNGEPYQKAAVVPKGEWFKLKVNVSGQRAAIWVGDQPPLVVETLAHSSTAGEIGIWTYQPAFFRNLKITAPKDIANLKGIPALAPLGAIPDWKLEGGGILKCEPNGVLNLNRYMQPSKEAKKISRKFHLVSSTIVTLGIGFSDVITLYIDGKKVYDGTHLFKGFADIPSRGWVTPNFEKLELPLEAGTHEITAELKVTEPFGWGLVITLNGQGIDL